ncbi:hypothetical protein ABEB36_009265 [Hypothenemus hampei]|uniref:Uncharacterized protein n=1 Tax=Hypothenemus hampei TaxID=57062 RepID=A0ABD1EGC2_HYPHA
MVPSIIGGLYPSTTSGNQSQVEFFSSASEPSSSVLQRSKKNNTVSEALQSISSSLKNYVTSASATDIFCQYLFNEMEKFLADLREELKDDIMTMLIEKRKLLRNRNNSYN